jgi:oligopeptide/dipeptide ABC transporter ATP-binding protein
VVREISHRVMVLYLGRVMETASSEQLYAAPRHPYTQALLAAALTVDPAFERARIHVRPVGEPPSPLDPEAGLRFLPSKRTSGAGNGVYVPRLEEVEPGHWVSEFDPV